MNYNTPNLKQVNADSKWTTTSASTPNMFTGSGISFVITGKG